MSKQHPTKQQLFGHLPSVSKAIQVTRTWYAGHCLEAKANSNVTVDLFTWMCQ